MSNEFTVEQLQELIKCAAENKIGEFLYEDENVKLRIRGPQTAALPVVPVQTEVAALAAQAADRFLACGPWYYAAFSCLWYLYYAASGSS